MGWYEGVEESRLLVASSDTGNGKGRFLQLLHPKTGNATCYLLINGGLEELNWFKQSYGSWLMGDYICENGGLYAATPIDPVFILLTMFDLARMKNGDDPGMFRPLDEIIYRYDYPGYRYLVTIAERSMEAVCDCKEIGSTKFFRLNDSKVLAWLYCKVKQLTQTLVKMDKNYAARSHKDTLADVVMILGEYLADDPWLKLLRNKLRLNMSKAVKAPHTETTASDHASFNPVQKKVNNQARNGKQNKKAKVETNSRSIKDMFTRASASALKRGIS